MPRPTLPSPCAPAAPRSDRPYDRPLPACRQSRSRGGLATLGPHPLARWAGLLAPERLVGGDLGRSAVDFYAAVHGARVGSTYPSLFDEEGLVRNGAARLLEDARSGRFDILVVPVVGALGADFWDATAFWARLRRFVDVHAARSGRILPSDLAPASMIAICGEV